VVERLTNDAVGDGGAAVILFRFAHTFELAGGNTAKPRFPTHFYIIL
jgi:hypothetical protein